MDNFIPGKLYTFHLFKELQAKQMKSTFDIYQTNNTTKVNLFDLIMLFLRTEIEYDSVDKINRKRYIFLHQNGIIDLYPRWAQLYLKEFNQGYLK